MDGFNIVLVSHAASRVDHGSFERISRSFQSFVRLGFTDWIVSCLHFPLEGLVYRWALPWLKGLSWLL